jgi:hypothetical protein
MGRDIHNLLSDTYTGWLKKMDSISYVVCRLGEEPVPVVSGMAWTVNGASTHPRRLVAVFLVLCWLYGLTCVGYAQNSLEFVSRFLLIHVVGRSFFLYTDRLNVETKTKRTLHSSRRLRFNELTKKKIFCCIVAILLSTDAAVRLCARRAL